MSNSYNTTSTRFSKQSINEASRFISSKPKREERESINILIAKINALFNSENRFEDRFAPKYEFIILVIKLIKFFKTTYPDFKIIEGYSYSNIISSNHDLEKIIKLFEKKIKFIFFIEKTKKRIEEEKKMIDVIIEEFRYLRSILSSNPGELDKHLEELNSKKLSSGIRTENSIRRNIELLRSREGRIKAIEKINRDPQSFIKYIEQHTPFIIELSKVICSKGVCTSFGGSKIKKTKIKRTKKNKTQKRK